MTTFFLVLAGIGSASLAVYALWAANVRREIAEGAQVAFERYQRDDPHLVAGLSSEAFHAIYARSTFPRFPKYFLASLAAFLVALPAVLALLTAVNWTLDRFDLVAEPVELAKYVPLGDGKTSADRAQREEMALYLAKDFAGFYYFFGVIGAWVATVAGSMKIYHLRRPADVRDELLRRHAELPVAPGPTAPQTATPSDTREPTGEL